MPFNYAAQRLRADRMIARYGRSPTGGPTYAKLRRNGVDRDCTAVEIAFSPMERKKLSNPVDRRVLISAEGLTEPPTTADSLVFFDENGDQTELLRLIEPPGKLAPAGIVVFYDLMVRG